MALRIAELAIALDSAITAILNATGAEVPKTEAERVAALEALLLERRAKTFPIDDFDRRPLADPVAPPQADWDKLDDYLAERAKVDEEIRRLAALFTEAVSCQNHSRSH